MTVVDHDCVPPSRDKFVAELAFEQLAETGVVSFENSPMSISHTERHIATRDANEIFICQQALQLDSPICRSRQSTLLLGGRRTHQPPRARARIDRAGPLGVGD